MWTDVGWLIFNSRLDILQDSVYMSGAHYEKEIIKLLETTDLVRNGGTAFDIGGHIGYYTLLLARKVGKNGSITTFEPHSLNYETLKETMKFNEIDWVTLENLSISDCNSELTLYETTDLGRTSAYNSINVPTRPFASASTTLDTYVFEICKKTPSFIKMDIEGSEWMALSGMRRLLKTIRPILMIEIHPQEIGHLGGDQKTFIDLLKDQYNYTLYRIHHKKGLTPLAAEPPQVSSWHLFALPGAN